MPRLKNTETGAVVNVDDDGAARLGSGWESADADDKSDKETKPAARKPRGKVASDAGGDDHTD